MRATVTQIGNSTGVILPKKAAARLKVKKGDISWTATSAWVFSLPTCFLISMDGNWLHRKLKP